MDRLAEHISMHLVKEDVCVMQDMQHQRMEVEEENARRVQLDTAWVKAGAVWHVVSDTTRKILAAAAAQHAQVLATQTISAAHRRLLVCVFRDMRDSHARLALQDIRCLDPTTKSVCLARRDRTRASLEHQRANRVGAMDSRRGRRHHVSVRTITQQISVQAHAVCVQQDTRKLTVHVWHVVADHTRAALGIRDVLLVVVAQTLNHLKTGQCVCAK